MTSDVQSFVKYYKVTWVFPQQDQRFLTCQVFFLAYRPIAFEPTQSCRILTCVIYSVSLVGIAGFTRVLHSFYFHLVRSYTPYEASNLANQKNRKLVVFDRKLTGSLSLHYVILLNIRE